MLDLESAIKHCEEVAEENENIALYKPIDFCVNGEIEECKKCAEQHRQLAEWLKELKRYRENDEVCK